MSETNKESKTFEQVIKTRRSVRNFTTEIPNIENVNEIIKSAIYAPYGSATGIALTKIRKIYVFKQDTENMKKVREIMHSQLKHNSRKLNIILSLFPFLKKKMKPFAERVKSISEKGIPSLKIAPYFIVIAEKKGFPAVEKQSIAHALENMWLTATSLGLGFQLISAVGTLSGNKEFLELLNLPKDQYALEGCVIGYPVYYSKEIKEFELDSYVTWLN
jgi:nitroreductase